MGSSKSPPGHMRGAAKQATPDETPILSFAQPDQSSAETEDAPATAIVPVLGSKGGSPARDAVIVPGTPLIPTASKKRKANPVAADTTAEACDSARAVGGAGGDVVENAAKMMTANPLVEGICTSAAVAGAWCLYLPCVVVCTT